MKAILLIHGYSTEGKDKKVEEIYGSLPAQLRKVFGAGVVKELNLSRWISLNNGIKLDDVSFAMDRALKSQYRKLLRDGFHVIIHSTGALVVRNWIRLFSPKPSPIQNIVHLAGANFGSGLAHVGQGPLLRWKNKIGGTGIGERILNELELGSSKTIDLHRHFIQDGSRIFEDYEVQEHCVIGSQTLPALKAVPIRYLKEDSSDNTVRTSAGNLNFNYVRVEPTEDASTKRVSDVLKVIKQRMNDEALSVDFYQPDLSGLACNRREIPFCVAYETAHFGEDIGIVYGGKNRAQIMKLIKTALLTEPGASAYDRTVAVFRREHQKTFTRAAKLKNSVMAKLRSGLLEWNRHTQYEGHAQLIFRLRDQFGNDVEHFDITFVSAKSGAKQENRIEQLIEDRHVNRVNPGTVTYYLRTQKFKGGKWTERLDKMAAVDMEITGHEPQSEDIAYVPLSLSLTKEQVKTVVQTFKTTIIDVTLLRLPKNRVFAIQKAKK